MPSFSAIDTFRESQWRAFRQFVLDERRDVGAREAAIIAEAMEAASGTIRWVPRWKMPADEVAKHVLAACPI